MLQFSKLDRSHEENDKKKVLKIIKCKFKVRLSPKLPTVPVIQESEILPLESPSCGSQVLKLLKLLLTHNRHYT